MADERQYLRRIPGVPDRCEPVASLAERLRKLDALFNNGRPVFVVPATVWPELCAVVEAVEKHEYLDTNRSALPDDWAINEAFGALARRMDEEGL